MEHYRIAIYGREYTTAEGASYRWPAAGQDAGLATLRAQWTPEALAQQPQEYYAGKVALTCGKSIEELSFRVRAAHRCFSAPMAGMEATIRRQCQMKLQ